MEITVRLRVTVDRESWADAFGLRTAAEITEDVRRYARTAVESQIQHAVDGNATVTLPVRAR